MASSSPQVAGSTSFDPSKSGRFTLRLGDSIRKKGDEKAFGGVRCENPDSKPVLRAMKLTLARQSCAGTWSRQEETDNEAWQR